MYKLVTILMILVAVSCFAQVAEPSRPMIQFPDGTYLSPDNPMPVTATVDISSISVDVFPVYADEAGDPETAELDASKRVKMNLMAEGIGLITGLGNIVTAIGVVNTSIGDVIKATQDIPLSPLQTVITKYTLTPNVAQVIEDLYVSQPNQRQKYVDIKTEDPESEFWVNIGATAVVGASRPCMGRFYIETRLQNVYVISESALDIYVTRAAISIQP